VNILVIMTGLRCESALRYSALKVRKTAEDDLPLYLPGLGDGDDDFASKIRLGCRAL